MIETEVVVIGAGPGGYVAAIKLGKLGRKTLLIEKDKLGGECLNYGCIPSKALIHVADEYHEAKATPELGAGAQALTLDWPKVLAWKNNVVTGFNRGVASLEKANGVAVAAGSARFTGPNELELVQASGKDTVRFEKAIIATGSYSVEIPGFKIDGQDVLGSKESLELAQPPKRLVIIGGGVIGLEIGTVYAKLGTKVTIVEFLPQLLTGIDPDFVLPVSRSLQKLGVDVFLNSKALGYQKMGDGLSVKIQTPEGEKTISADKILLAVGRAPRTKELNLGAASVETDAKGHVKVDASSRTSAAHIFAIGDVVGAPYLAHKASREGIIAATAICGFTPEERGAIPWAVFTDPEIAYVGETTDQVKARGGKALIGRFPFSASGRAQAVRRTDGFAKVVADAETHRILGAGFVGPNAGDLIGEASLAIKLGATVEDIASTIHPHPTLNEAFQEAAEACLGQAIHIMAVRAA